jgi:hypothetical protein
MQYIRIKKAQLVPDTFGKHLKITMIGLYEKDPKTGEEKHIRWVKLNDPLMELLLKTNIPL